jgi:two-component system response regulator MprA
MAEPRRVLLIEDDATIRHVVAEVLADVGFAVREAADGLAALEQLAAWRPDVIVLDLMMPGLDGRAFRAEQRARGLAAEAPLVVLSASRYAVEAGAELGAAAVVAKPFDLDDLLAAIGPAIRAGPNAAASP